MSNRTFIFASLVVIAPSLAFAQSKEPPTYQLAPSLPPLTQKEHVANWLIVRAMVLDDIEIAGTPNRKAIREAFSKLGRESVPQMVEWMNKSNQEGWTCPGTILGTKITNLLDKERDTKNLDIFVFVRDNLGKGVTTKKHLEQYLSLQGFTTGKISLIEGELRHDYKTMKLDALLKRLGEFEKQPSTKHAEWRLAISIAAERKDNLRCFDVLIASLENAKTPNDRRAVHAALVRIAGKGVDHGPFSFETDGGVSGAVSRWRKWHQQTKN